MSRQQKSAGVRKDRQTPRALMGGIPWPALGDQEPYVLKGDNRPFRVRHLERLTETGTLQSVEWCHPGGAYMSERMKPATKTREAQPLPGAWWGIVAWDGRDDAGREPILARQPLAILRVE